MKNDVVIYQSSDAPEIVGGVLEDETRDMLTAYFRRKRKQKKECATDDSLS